MSAPWALRFDSRGEGEWNVLYRKEWLVGFLFSDVGQVNVKSKCVGSSTAVPHRPNYRTCIERIYHHASCSRSIPHLLSLR